MPLKLTLQTNIHREQKQWKCNEDSVVVSLSTHNSARSHKLWQQCLSRQAAHSGRWGVSAYSSRCGNAQRQDEWPCRREECSLGGDADTRPRSDFTFKTTLPPPSLSVSLLCLLSTMRGGIGLTATCCTFKHKMSVSLSNCLKLP